MIVEVPYAELQCMLDDPPGYRNYWSAEYNSYRRVYEPTFSIQG
jgi:hypothetical protein